jgi:outer membrane scaffolding protein for murein synthesis (MipA/OmpV family)
MKTRLLLLTAIAPMLLSIPVMSIAANDSLSVTVTVQPRDPRPGDTITIAAHTQSGASCKGQFVRQIGGAYNPLKETQADDSGVAKWTFRLAYDIPAGERTVTIWCSFNGATASGSTHFEVH